MGALAILLALPLTSIGSAPLGGAIRGLRTIVPGITHVVSQVVQRTAQSTPVLGSGGSGASSGSGGQPSGSPAQQSGNGSPNTPAMYGTNPHGQGTVLSVMTSPSTNVPYQYNPNGSPGEQVVIGRGRSEQKPDGSYHAHTTILALLGMEILGVDAGPGQTKTGPLDAIQKGILDQVCTGTGMFVCLTVLAADTAATSDGASTNFSVAHATVGGKNGVDTGVAESNSQINQTGSCQTASGSSSAASVNINGGPAASLAQSSESSKACSDGTKSQTANSSVLDLAGQGVPLPQPGCANHTPNTVFDILGLVRTICNADSTSEAAAPSGVREALTAIVLPAVGTALAKTVVAASESHAVAPAASRPTCTDSDHDCGNGPPLTNSCPGFPIDNVDNDGDCDHPTGGHKHHVGGQHKQCPDSDHDCGVGPPGTGKCTNDTTDNDGDCVLPGGGSETGVKSAVSGAATTEEAELRTTEEAEARTLPFTGEDVLKVLLVGLLLTGGGLALGFRTRRG